MIVNDFALFAIQWGVLLEIVLYTDFPLKS